MSQPLGLGLGDPTKLNSYQLKIMLLGAIVKTFLVMGPRPKKLCKSSLTLKIVEDQIQIKK